MWIEYFTNLLVIMLQTFQNQQGWNVQKYFGVSLLQLIVELWVLFRCSFDNLRKME
jgi:hypothetical protein